MKALCTRPWNYLLEEAVGKLWHSSTRNSFWAYGSKVVTCASSRSMRAACRRTVPSSPGCSAAAACTCFQCTPWRLAPFSWTARLERIAHHSACSSRSVFAPQNGLVSTAASVRKRFQRLWHWRLHCRSGATYTVALRICGILLRSFRILWAGVPKQALIAQY